MCTICAQFHPFADDCVYAGTTIEEAGDAPSTINASVDATLRSGDVFTGDLGAGDIDVVRIEVQPGDGYTLLTGGDGSESVEDTVIVLYDADGNEVARDDDAGVGRHAQVSFVAEAGTYFAAVMSYETENGFPSIDTGAYRLELNASSGTLADNGKPVYSPDQVAEQLTQGYWSSTGQPSRKFDESVEGGQSAVITFNHDALTAEGRWFADKALSAWSDVTGITFAYTGSRSSADITFDDNGTGAYAYSNLRSGGFINSSHVNVSTSWIRNDHYTLNSYSHQTYLHEIGHALGLGHPGNYNASGGGQITYGNSAEFANDSWQTTVMSYFSQTQNTHTNATRAFVLTPTVADILALQSLYGVAGTQRTGDTVYGVGSTAGDFYDNVAQNYTRMSFTILDDGGIDTVDFSGTSADQRVDLTEESFSDVGGEIGNMAIARGTVLENVVLGSGDDEIVGNAADNVFIGGGGDDVMDGGAGRDTVSYESASSGIVASLSSGTATGQGTDILISIENLIGSAKNDTLRGNGAANVLEGKGGDDFLEGLAGDDELLGGDGADELRGGSGNDTLSGGRGSDILKGWNGNDLLKGDDGNDTLEGMKGTDTLNGGNGRDTLEGGDGADTLNGGEADDKLYGGAHNDTLLGGSGRDTLHGDKGNDRLDGQTGNDTLKGGSGSDIFVFDAGSGSDVIKDFNLSQDSVDLTGWDLSGKSELSQYYGSNSEGSAQIRFNSSNILTFDGLDAADLASVTFAL